MKTFRRIRVGAAFFVCLLGAVCSAEGVAGGRAGSETGSLNLRQADLAPFFVFQYGGIRHGGVLAEWAPTYRMSDEFQINGYLGMGFMFGAGQGIFLVDFAVAGNYLFSPDWFAEVGLGVQMWMSGGSSTNFSIPVKIGRILHHHELFSWLFVERMYLGYTLMPSAQAHLFAAGFGFSF